MEDLGLPLALLLGGVANLTAALPLDRFRRPIGALLIIATLAWFWLWLSHLMLGTKMILAAPVPAIVPILLVVAALSMHTAVYIRRGARRPREKNAAQRPQ
jgi:hypothetical protein